jgi:hypothetical protein
MSCPFVLGAIVIRLLPPACYVTPLGAMLLSSGPTFRSKRDSLLVPLGAVLLSNYAVIHFIQGGHFPWFSPYTWTGFLLVGVLGWTLRNELSVTRVLVASVAGSVTFFLISIFEVWMGWRLYPPTLGGLVDCYAADLPFFRNSLVGDLAYCCLMFGTYAWFRRRHCAVASGTRP